MVFSFKSNFSAVFLNCSLSPRKASMDRGTIFITFKFFHLADIAYVYLDSADVCMDFADVCMISADVCMISADVYQIFPLLK